MYQKSIEEFTKQLASSSPTPSGGGACSLVGAIGACLAEMVGNLTIGKKKYAQYQPELQQLQVEMESLRVQLLDGINADAQAFLPLSHAYSMDKNDPNRPAEMERCLKLAAQGPYQILLHICQAIELIARYGQIGSKLAISDAATAAILCYGALYGANINVKVNTKLMKDTAYQQQLNQEIDQLTEIYGQKALETYHQIAKEMQ